MSLFSDKPTDSPWVVYLFNKFVGAPLGWLISKVKGNQQ